MSLLLERSARVSVETLTKEDLEWFIYADLWGNKADLSFIPTGASISHETHDTEDYLHKVLVNDAASVADTMWQHIQRRSPMAITFVVDNCGMEIVTDLVFAEVLLRCGVANSVRLVCKTHPLYGQV